CRENSVKILSRLGKSPMFLAILAHGSYAMMHCDTPMPASGVAANRRDTGCPPAPPQALADLGKRGENTRPQSCPVSWLIPAWNERSAWMSSPQWHFANFRLDLANACLWRGGETITLTLKAFEVLHYLVTQPDRLVTKDALLDAVWPATAVSDAVVRVTIGELRRALGDMVRAPRFIATVHRRGYRFLAPVTQTTYLDAANPAPPLMPALPLPASAGCHVRPAATPLVGREA